MSMSPEAQKKTLSEILQHFSPTLSEEIAVRGKKLALSDPEIIARAEEIIGLASQSNLPVPETTLEVARYGPTVQEILNNLAGFTTEITLKKLSPRRGKAGVKYEVLDVRRITSFLKKAKKPRAKCWDDKRVADEFIKETRSHVKANKPAEAAEILEKGFQLFIDRKSPHFAHLRDLLESCRSMDGILKDLTSRHDEIKTRKNELESLNSELRALEESIEKSEAEARSTPEGRLVSELEQKLNSQMGNNALKKYLKLLRDATHNFARGLEQTDCSSRFSTEALDAVARDSLDPTNTFDHQALVDDLCGQPERLFNSRKWFRSRAQNFDDLRRLLLRQEAVEPWSAARETRRELRTALGTLSRTSIKQKIAEKADSAEKLAQSISELSFQLERLELEARNLSREMENLQAKFSE